MRILLIDTAFLGDLFLATPLIRAASQVAVGGRIDLLTSPSGEAATRHHPLLDSVFVLSKRQQDRGLAGFRRALAWIGSRQPEVALLPRRSLRSALLARRAKVPRRIGFERGMARYLCTDRVPFKKPLHQVQRNLELVRPLGLDPGGAGLAGHPIEAFPSAAEVAEVEDWMVARGMGQGERFVALAPGSVWPTKRWPLERYTELAVRLAADWHVVVIGGDVERGMARDLCGAAQAAGVGERVHAAAGSWSPTATVALLRRAAALVTNDSGAMHIGQASGVPLVALYGPTLPEFGFAPRGEQHQILGVEGLACRPCGRHGSHRCPELHWRCMRDLETGRVERAVREIGRRAA